MLPISTVSFKSTTNKQYCSSKTKFNLWQDKKKKVARQKGICYVTKSALPCKYLKTPQRHYAKQYTEYIGMRMKCDVYSHD